MRDERVHVGAREHLCAEDDPVDSCADGRAELVPSPRLAELEEGVPV